MSFNFEIRKHGDDHQKQGRQGMMTRMNDSDSVQHA
jgi:hypothetical protein